MYLHEDWDDGEAADDCAVVSLSREDVEGADGALHDLLHPNPVCIGAGGTPARTLLGVLQ